MFFCKSLSNLSKLAMQQDAATWMGFESAVIWSRDTDICLYPHFSWLVLTNFAFMFTDQRMIFSKTIDWFPRVLQTTDSRIGNDHDWCNRRRNWNDWKDSNVRQMSLCPYCTNVTHHVRRRTEWSVPSVFYDVGWTRAIAGIFFF